MFSCEELLAELHRQAITAKARADGAYQTWKIAPEDCARKRIVDAVGVLPAPCTVDVGDGTEPILIEGVKQYWGESEPSILFRRRTKSGKWTKVVYTMPMPDSVEPIPAKIETETRAVRGQLNNLGGGR